MSRRAQILSLQHKLAPSRKLKERLDTRLPVRVEFRGLLGDHDGNVLCDDDNHRLVYVRREGRAVISNVLNLSVALIPDMPVLVGYSREFPNQLQVLSVAAGDLGYALGKIGLVSNHHRQHEFRRDGTGGNDAVWAAKQQIVDGLIYPSDPYAMTVEMHKCLYHYASGWYFMGATTSAGLGGSVPGAGLARFVLISIDTTADPHALQTTDGDTFPTVLFPPDEADTIPDPPSGSVPLAAIYIEDATGELTWDNILDCRLGIPAGVTGVATASAHELLDGSVHSDTVDVGPTRGDIVVADSTPEWNVLTAGAAGAILNMDALGEDPEWLALGAAGGILKVNPGADSLEYLGIGARGGILVVNAGADSVEYLAIGAATRVLKSDGTDPAWGIVDVSEVTYTPADNTDWDGDADPGDADDALDQLAERTTDIEGGAANGLIFSQIEDVTLDNDTAETTILGAGRGAKEIGADLLDVGSVIRLTVCGYLSATASPTLDIDIDIGGSEVCSTGAFSVATVTDVGFRLEIDVTCRSTGGTGTVIATGTMYYGDGNKHDLIKTTTTTLDTTAALSIDVTGEWSVAAAGNTITCQLATIELIEADFLAVAAPIELAATEV